MNKDAYTVKDYLNIIQFLYPGDVVSVGTPIPNKPAEKEAGRDFGGLITIGLLIGLGGGLIGRGYRKSGTNMFWHIRNALITQECIVPFLEISRGTRRY